MSSAFSKSDDLRAKAEDYSLEERRKRLSWCSRSEKLCKLGERLREGGCYLIKTVKTFSIAKHVDVGLTGNVK